MEDVDLPTSGLDLRISLEQLQAEGHVWPQMKKLQMLLWLVDLCILVSLVPEAGTRRRTDCSLVLSRVSAQVLCLEPIEWQ